MIATRLFVFIYLLSFAVFAAPIRLSAQTTAPPGLQYNPLPTPCRAIDTRLTGGPIAGGTSRTFNPAGGGCSISLPSRGPIAYAMNVTVVPRASLGYLTVWPAGEPQPVVSTLNSDGRVKANAAIVAGGDGGAISVFATDTTDLVLDVTGTFTQTTAYVGAYTAIPTSYTYVPVTPCRLIDTRLTTLGAPSLVATQTRVFNVANNSCLSQVGFALNNYAPDGGSALALNITAVPIAGHPVSYLTVWGGLNPSAAPVEPPLISVLNAPNGTPVANAAIVSMVSGAGLGVYSTDTTDLVVDVTGYFAPEAMTAGGLSLSTLPPCRVLDTRDAHGAFEGELTVPFTTGNGCGVPQAAQSYVVNATVIPEPVLDYLTLWPDQTAQPVVSTLNAPDGSVTSNMAIVGSTNGSVDAFTQPRTQLVLDISSYLAPLQDTSGLKVVFIGDDETQQAVAAVQSAHPNWINAGGSVGETTGSMLARFQTDVIDKHPDVVVIKGGQYDIVTPGWGVFTYTVCGGSGVTDTCGNTGAMATMAYAAGIQAFVSTIDCTAACLAMIPALGGDPGTVVGEVQLAFQHYDQGLEYQQFGNTLQGDPYTHAILLQSGDLIGGTIAALDAFH